MKRLLAAMLSLCLCISLSACMDDMPPQQKREETATIFESYQQYGLEYEMKLDRLYYNSELVRYFEDIVDEDHYMKWPSQDGTVDVFAVRNDAGLLTGVEQFDEQSFESRTSDLQNVTIFELQITHSINADGYTRDEAYDWYTSDDAALVKDELDRIYAAYQQYGLSYDRESDRLYYDEALVGYFEDEVKGYSFGPYDDSTIKIYAIRDKSGVLTGLDVDAP